jgi:hypothetical protein
MTKKAIKPGEIIVSLPHSLLITTRFALSSEIGQFIKRYNTFICTSYSNRNFLVMYIALVDPCLLT